MHRDEAQRHSSAPCKLTERRQLSRTHYYIYTILRVGQACVSHVVLKVRNTSIVRSINTLPGSLHRIKSNSDLIKMSASVTTSTIINTSNNSSCCRTRLHVYVSFSDL